MLEAHAYLSTTTIAGKTNGWNGSTPPCSTLASVLAGCERGHILWKEGCKGGREGGEDQEAKVIILMAVVGTGRRRRADGGVGGDASEGEGGIKVGESERKKGRVRSVWRPTEAPVRMTLVKIMALSRSFGLAGPRFRSDRPVLCPLSPLLLKRPFGLFEKFSHSGNQTKIRKRLFLLTESTQSVRLKKQTPNMTSERNDRTLRYDEDD